MNVAFDKRTGWARLLVLAIALLALVLGPMLGPVTSFECCARGEGEPTAEAFEVAITERRSATADRRAARSWSHPSAAAKPAGLAIAPPHPSIRGLALSSRNLPLLS